MTEQKQEKKQDSGSLYYSCGCVCKRPLHFQERRIFMQKRPIHFQNIQGNRRDAEAETHFIKCSSMCKRDLYMSKQDVCACKRDPCKCKRNVHTCEYNSKEPDAGLGLALLLGWVCVKKSYIYLKATYVNAKEM